MLQNTGEFMWKDVRRSFIPRLGLRLSCTLVCFGLGPGVSGRLLCTSRWLCRKPRGDAPMSP